MAPYHALDNQAGSPKQRSPALSVRKDSPNAPPRRDWQAGTASTPKPAGAPTIRVIHIFAPKVIKTDMANFRSTVQKLTGRNPKKSSRGRTKTPTESSCSLSPSPSPVTMSLPLPQPTMEASITSLWDHQQQTEVLHRLVGDACGDAPLVRSSSVESSTYSFSSDSTDQTSDLHLSPTDSNSFTFYVPQHRESAYSLSEIPAPFLHGADMHTAFPNVSLPLQMPSPAMESMLGTFDVDNLGCGLGSPQPLSEVTTGFDVTPFSVLGSGGSSSGGGLYDMVAPQHCRLSVQQPNIQGGNFFEMI